MAAQLTELGRRVLGHLPPWAADEDALIEAEGGPDVSIRSYTLAELTARLAEDPSINPPLDEGGVQLALEGLHAAGLAGRRGEGWRMNKAGLEALEAPVESAEPPGAVLVELHPAKAVIDATAQADA